jgi:hypothetical protein
VSAFRLKKLGGVMKLLKNRMVILALAITMIAGTLACSTTTLVGRRADPTATPTKTPKPTFTITPTPTNTPIPTDTPRPTDTPTPVTPTNTPLILTATPTPLPTDTPLPTATPVPPTNTPKPTSKPKPRPTATPTKKPAPQPTAAPQFAWSGVIDNRLANCGLTRVFGHTLASNGGLAGDVWVHYWADGWSGDWAKSGWTDFGAGTSWKGDEGNWDGTIDVRPREGVWHVCVTDADDSWTCISNTVDAATNYDCATGTQVVHITFKKN